MRLKFWKQRPGPSLLPKFCSRCGCPMVPVSYADGSDRFDTTTGAGLRPMRDGIHCANWDKDLGWRDHDWRYVGPRYWKPVTGACS